MDLANPLSKEKEKEPEATKGKKEITKEELQKIDARIVTVCICLLIILIGGVGFLVYKSKQKTEEVAFTYNGFDFKRTDRGYKAEIYINQNKDPSYFTVRFKPQDLENISIDADIGKEIIKKKQIYVLIDPYANLTGVTTMATLELQNVLENAFLFNIPLNASFTQFYDKAPTIKVKSCADASETTEIIYMTLGEETKIYAEGKCIIFEAVDENDFIREANRLTLTALSIMKP